MNVYVDVKLLLSNATSVLMLRLICRLLILRNHIQPHLVRGRGASRTSYVAAVWEGWARSTSELDNPNLGANPNPSSGVNPNLGLGSDARPWRCRGRYAEIPNPVGIEDGMLKSQIPRKANLLNFRHSVVTAPVECTY